MGSFSTYTNYNPLTNFSGVKFGAAFRLLEVELNEMQEIAKERSRSFIRKHVGDGIYGDGTMSYSAGVFTIENENAIVDGNLVVISSLTLNASSGQSIYLDVWETEIQGSYTIKQYGNQQTLTTIPNYIIDSRMGQETTRRLQVVFNLSTSNNVAGHKYLLLGTISGTSLIKQARFLNSNVVGNAGGVPSIQMGLDAAKPTPDVTKSGRLYIATDSRKIWQDTGTAWEPRGGSTTILENFTTQIQTEIDAGDVRFTGTKRADANCWNGQCVYASTPPINNTGRLLGEVIFNNLKFGDYTLIVRTKVGNNTVSSSVIEIRVAKNISGTWNTISLFSFGTNKFPDTVNYKNIYVPFEYQGVKATNNQIKVSVSLNGYTTTPFEVSVDFIDVLHSTANVYY